MKKLILIILTTITILGVNAQGNNLQFNRALFEDLGTINYFSSNNPASFIVPAGKVWKIVNVDCMKTWQDRSTVIYVTKASDIKTRMSVPMNNNDIDLIWLPEGDYDIYINGIIGASYNWGDVKVILSGIEFNIVQ